MIRPFTLITAMLFLLSGAAMFAVKHHAQVLDDQIAAAHAATRLDEQRMLVLNAQWSQYTQGDRLQQFASKYTALAPTLPAQLVTLAALPSVLPPAGSRPPMANPETAAPDAVAQTGQAPVTDPAVLMADAAPPVDSQSSAMFTPSAAPVASPVPRHPPVVLAAARTVPAARGTHQAVPAPVRLAVLAEPAVHHHRLRVLHHQPESELAMASVHDTHPFIAPAGTQIVAARVVEPAAPVVQPAVDEGGSMLGMAQNMGAGGVN